MPETIGPFDILARAVFYGFAALTLAGAWVSVSARNLFRAAIGLAAALFGVAVLYLFLRAEFLAVTQLLIYVGAILTLLIFGVMLTARIADAGVEVAVRHPVRRIRDRAERGGEQPGEEPREDRRDGDADGDDRASGLRRL